MPPKKAKSAAAATPAKKARTFVPDTITTNRGKDIETTAALARPRRETVKPATVVATAAASKVTKSKRAPAKAATTTASSAVSPKRGRPAKSAASPKRGRPAKSTVQPAKKSGRPSTKTVAEHAPSKKRDRPSAATAEEDTGEPPKKRGRPSKAATTSSATTSSTKKPSRPAKAAASSSGRKPGRPSKAKNQAHEPEEAPDAPDTPAPRKRGRGPKGGETTKISTDDGDAAGQLEEELIDEAVKSASKSKAPDPTTAATSNASKGKVKATSSAGQNEEQAKRATSSGKSFWLMKAEQIDREETLKSGRVFNTKFTIDDLKQAGAPEPWDGVRNLVARNNMRAMSVGDLAFFYASQGKGKLQPGITGIMEVVKEHEPDQSVFNEDSYGFVEPDKRKGENQWSIVHVEFRKKLSTPVSLKELQKYGGSGVLGNMEVLKQSRLSVTKVSEKEWNFIVNDLIQGYEDHEDDVLLDVPVKGPNPKVPPTLQAEAALALPLSTKGTSRPASRAASKAPSRAAPHVPSRAASRQASLAPPITQTTEAIIATTSDAVDSAAQFSLAESSKPASRAGSRKPTSRAPSVNLASRAGSLAPPSRAGSVGPTRGRSLTPKVRGSGSIEDEEDGGPAQGFAMRSIAEEEAFDFA